MGIFVSPSEDEENKKVNTSAFKKKIWAYQFKKIGVVVAVVVAIIVIISVLWRTNANSTYTGYEVINSVECAQYEGSTVVSFQNQFLTYSIDGIHCTDAKGKDVWSVPFEMQKPMVDVRGNYIATADYNGRTVYIFNQDGELGTIQTSAPIKNISASATGTVAVLTDDEHQTPINLYYYDGRQIASFRTTMSKSGYPIAIALSDDSKLLAVSYLYLDNGIMTSKVAFYNFGEVGKNEADNLVSGYDYQKELIPAIHFLSDSSIFAVANDKLIYYEGKEKPVNKYNIFLQEEVQSVYYGDNHVGLLYNDTTGQARYRLDVYDKDRVVSQIFITDEYSDIIFANGMVIIYNATGAKIYTMNGKTKFDGMFESSVRLVIPTNSSNKYILVHNDCIETVVLK